MIKFTIAQLEQMSLKQLKALDITSPLEEKMISDIMLSKGVNIQPVVKFNQNLVPDIKNPADEKVWQDKIDKFNDDNKPVEVKVIEAEKALEAVKGAIVAEVKVEEVLATPTVVTVQNGEIVKPFCDQCTSKGVRHKKECKLYVPTIKNDTSSN